MKRNRILHIVSSLDLTNGIMNVIMNYYRYIDKDKFQFDFLYFIDSQKDSYASEIIELGGTVVKIKPPQLHKLVSYKKYLLKTLESDFPYDIIHFHENVLLSLISPALRSIKNVEIIAHGHSVVYSYNILKSFRNKILSIPLKNMADHLFACSREAALFWYGEKAVRERKVEIIKNAIECTKFKFNNELRFEIRNELNLEDKLVIGHVGRFNKEKNHEFLIKVFKEIEMIHPESVLLLVGDGPKKDEVNTLVCNLHLENKVVFLGRRKDVNKIYQAMDIFVFPSISEGFGTVAIEAQISGLPCNFSNNLSRDIGLNNFQFISLEEHSSVWAEKILSNTKRNYAWSDFNYCIEKEVENLEKLYERILDIYGR